MDSIKRVGQYLINNADSISLEMVKLSLDKLEIEFPVELINQSVKANAEFLVLLAESFNESDENAAQELIEWSKKYGEQQASMISQLSALIKPYADNRLTFIKRITKISIDHNLTTENVVAINNRVSYLMDVSMIETIFAYEAYRDELMKERQLEIDKLSAPIVPIQQGISVLPLIGVIDYPRVQHLLNNVLPGISLIDTEHLIIDFSGILTIDTEVAQHIFTIHNVLKLLGIHVMFTGIRPNLSMAVVQAGIDFTAFKTFGSVKQAIESIK